jgi:hypothetical protein
VVVGLRRQRWRRGRGREDADGGRGDEREDERESEREVHL